MVSPADSSGRARAIIASIGSPEGIMNRMTRGVCRPLMKLSRDLKAWRLPERSSASWMKSSIHETSRLVTATLKPLAAMLRARALPMVPRP
jgi:hypothetical protein